MPLYIPELIEKIENLFSLIALMRQEVFSSSID